MLRGRRGLASRIRRPGEYFCRIDVSALWSVILAFYIVTVAWPVPYHGNFTDLPKVLNAWQFPGALRNDAIRITLTRDGRYFLGPSQISLDEMAQRIRGAVRVGSERLVFLNVDKRVKYRSVKAAAAEIRKGGVEKISFLTQ